MTPTEQAIVDYLTTNGPTEYDVLFDAIVALGHPAARSVGRTMWKDGTIVRSISRVDGVGNVLTVSLPSGE